MRPDLNAIRKKWRERSIVDGNDVPTLLAYIDELERRTTYTVGETEWANRIAHAEARFVDEYDARKAAERQVEELKARIVTLEAMR